MYAALLGVAAASVHATLEHEDSTALSDNEREGERVTLSDDPPDGPRPLSHLREEFGAVHGRGPPESHDHQTA
jgi:hypothetical protein